MLKYTSRVAADWRRGDGGACGRNTRLHTHSPVYIILTRCIYIHIYEIRFSGVDFRRGSEGGAAAYSHTYAAAAAQSVR